ncbi:MAG: hypothetical protein LBB45_05805 [Methanobrevibacter sp.]|nr:hypothetical protein [Candidatus Methanovirga basalitermitum]
MGKLIIEPGTKYNLRLNQQITASKNNLDRLADSQIMSSVYRTYRKAKKNFFS